LVAGKYLYALRSCHRTGLLGASTELLEGDARWSFAALGLSPSEAGMLDDASPEAAGRGAAEGKEQFEGTAPPQ